MYVSDTLPGNTPVVATLDGANPVTLTAADVYAHLSRAYNPDTVDLHMMTLDTARKLSVIRKGQRVTFTVQGGR